ncbi:MAG: tetratricopeptide repeat protein [Flavobacteriales bacterium]|nr:tetratricopeptide repeat protein [Flavobacteriales bacterium]MBP6698271.1 tetratricopeptide repeat protein [Flavobacteriales bacterium]
MQEKKTRRLAAIMFTDIVGYTALMHGDEAVATTARARHRAVFRQQHELHHGEIVQYYGDGTLSVFQSAIEAAKCAVAIQRLLREGEPLPLRIGLHMGDILFDSTEVYGDGVNMASRIQSMGVAGAVLLSGKLNDELRNHDYLPTVSAGFFDLKNIAHPVEVFAIASDGLVVPSPHDLAGWRKSVDKTVAVLPFVNMSASAENEYFSDGITEEIINALAKVKSLKVTSRTSSFYFKDKSVPIKQIGRDLNVSTILEGSVRLSGDTVRITAQLIQAEQDFHFWSETWDRKLSNIFEVQDEISLVIAEKLREQFGHFAIQEHLVEKQTDSIDAYGYFLKAQFHANKWNPADANTAIALYQKAVSLDPEHTASYLGMAHCYGFLATSGAIPPEEGWAKGRHAANEALRLDPRSADAHHLLAHQAFFEASNFGEAMRHAQQALDLEPNHVEAHRFKCFLHCMAGDIELARPHMEEVLRLDPLSQSTLFHNAYFHYMAQDFDAALERLDRCLAENRMNFPAHYIKCNCLLMMGRCDEVIAYFGTMPVELVLPANRIGLTGLAHALRGRAEQAMTCFEELLPYTEGSGGYGAQYYVFLMRANMGEGDRAFEWVRYALDNSISVCNFADPLVNALKDDPRYAALHKEIYSVARPETAVKDGTETTDADASDRLAVRLLRHMSERKPYLDPALSLRSLADQLDVHPNQLSWLLQEAMGKNFNEFIDGYRAGAVAPPRR